VRELVNEQGKAGCGGGEAKTRRTVAHLAENANNGLGRLLFTAHNEIMRPSLNVAFTLCASPIQQKTWPWDLW